MRGRLLGFDKCKIYLESFSKHILLNIIINIYLVIFLNSCSKLLKMSEIVGRNCVACDEEEGKIKISNSPLILRMFSEIVELIPSQIATLCKKCNDELKGAYNFKKRVQEINNVYKEENLDFMKSSLQETVQKSHVEKMFLIGGETCETDVFGEVSQDYKHVDVTEMQENEEHYSEDDGEENNSDYFLDKLIVQKTEEPVEPVEHPRAINRSRQETVKGEKLIEEDMTDMDQNVEEVFIEEETLDDEEWDSVSNSNTPQPQYYKQESSLDRFNCHICNKNFKKASVLKNHLNSHNNIRHFKCNYEGCLSDFVTINGLNRHMRKVHHADETEVVNMRNFYIDKEKAQKKPFPKIRQNRLTMSVYCEICKKVLASAKYLQEHMALQHDNNAPHQCTICDKRYVSIALLEKHQKYHNGQRDFKCKYCHKSYVERKSYNQHLRKSHQCTAEEIEALKWDASGSQSGNKCTECHKVFETPKRMQEHKATIHGLGNIDINIHHFKSNYNFCLFCRKTLHLRCMW